MMLATNSALSPIQPKLTKAEQAEQELANRELARRHLIDFCAYVDPDAANSYRSPHLELAADYVERAMDGSLWDGVPGSGKKVLIITMPPGHWKSSTFSRKFPAWFVGHQTDLGKPHQIILTSYNANLAQANNSKVLELMQGPRYKNIFPDVKLSPKQQNSEEWSLVDVPYTSCKAAGVGGGLTGFHGQVIVVDDPIKDRKEANSKTTIDNLWSWWVDVTRTRLLNEDSFVLGIWTRWSEDDPAGKLMKMKRDGQSDERVVMLRLPALAETEAERRSAVKLGLPYDPVDPLGREPGEALWPENESATEHEATKRSFPLTFDSLYQGRPRPAGGYMVNENMFKMLPALPTENVRWVWATDFALTEKEVSGGSRGPDYSAVGLIGLWKPTGQDDDVRLVVGYMRRDQLEIFDAINMVEETVQTMKRPYPIINGQANFEKVVLGIMRRRATFLRYSVKNLKRSELAGDKVSQAQPWLEMAQAGLVYVVQGAWNVDFFNEAENFPYGANDDQIDVVSVGSHALGLAKKKIKPHTARIDFYG